MKHLIPCLLCLCASTATAQSICDGQYAQAGALLDAAYSQNGTLHAGGNYWHRRDNIGVTLDIYRLLQGLDDLNLRRAETIYQEFPDDPLLEESSVHAAFTRLLPTFQRATELSDDDAYLIATTADMITTSGPAFGWWLTDPPLQELTERERATRDLAREEPLVNWLQYIMAASDAPWAYGWHLSSGRASNSEAQAYQALASRAFDDYRAGDGLAWAVAGLSLMSHNAPAMISLSEDWFDDVTDCGADAATYAAYAIARFEILRAQGSIHSADADVLPSEMRRLAFEQLSMGALLNAHRDHQPFGSAEALATLAPDDTARHWANVGHSFRAATIEELIDIHASAPLDPRSFRLLNILSADNIVAFANADGRHDDDRRILLSAAAARYFALGQDDAAAALLPEIAALSAEDSDGLDAILSARHPKDRRIALFLLALPDPATWITADLGPYDWSPDIALTQRIRTKRGLDLPFELRSASYLQRDLEVWLRLPSRWDAYFGMRGASLGYIDRAHWRGVQPNAPRRIPQIPPQSPDAQGMELAHLIAWDELARLGPSHGVAWRISNVVVDWAETDSDRLFFRLFTQSEDIADALEQVIALQARNAMASRADGKPPGQRAFELLNRRYYDTAAAARSVVWQRCSNRCDE